MTILLSGVLHKAPSAHVLHMHWLLRYIHAFKFNMLLWAKQNVRIFLTQNHVFMGTSTPINRIDLKIEIIIAQQPHIAAFNNVYAVYSLLKH